MHRSGILVVARKRRLRECLDAVVAQPGVEIFYVYPHTNRVILVQATKTEQEQEECLRRLRSLADVDEAKLVYHRIEPSRPLNHSDWESSSSERMPLIS